MVRQSLRLRNSGRKGQRGSGALGRARRSVMDGLAAAKFDQNLSKVPVLMDRHSFSFEVLYIFF